MKKNKVLNFSKESNQENLPLREYISHEELPNTARLFNNLLNRFADDGVPNPFNKSLLSTELESLLCIAAGTDNQEELETVANILVMAIPPSKKGDVELLLNYFTHSYMNEPTEDDIKFYSSVYY